MTEIAPNRPNSSQIIEKSYHSSLRHETELLETLAQSLSKQTAGTDRIQTLEHLITAGTCILHQVDQTLIRPS